MENIGKGERIKAAERKEVQRKVKFLHAFQGNKKITSEIFVTIEFNYQFMNSA